MKTIGKCSGCGALLHDLGHAHLFMCWCDDRDQKTDEITQQAVRPTEKPKTEDEE